MKRFLSITLAALILAMCGTMAVDAKKKGHKSRSGNSAVPSVDFIINKLGGKDLTSLKEYSGVKLIYKDVGWEDGHQSGTVYFGKNAKADKRGHVTATGPHAWYVSYSWDTDHGYCIAFKSKADCDAFWEKYKNSQYVDDFNRDNWKDWGLPISVTNDGWHEIYLDDH